MAVSALPRTRVATPDSAASLSWAALVLALVAPTLDVLMHVQPVEVLAPLAIAACAGAGAVLLLVWMRHPRASWLAAASLACFASVALRVAGADVAPALSLLAVVALGLGGAFASHTREADSLLA
jgi:hypothetical protein